MNILNIYLRCAYPFSFFISIWVSFFYLCILLPSISVSFYLSIYLTIYIPRGSREQVHLDVEQELKEAMSDTVAAGLQGQPAGQGQGRRYLIFWIVCGTLTLIWPWYSLVPLHNFFIIIFGKMINVRQSSYSFPIFYPVKKEESMKRETGLYSFFVIQILLLHLLKL